MNLKELIISEVEHTFAGAEKLMDLVDESTLDWKPSTGTNWMTTGQVLRHMADACGAPVKGFVTGEWGMPEDFDPATVTPEEMFPPAEKFLTVESVAEAKAILSKDKKLALEMIASCSMDDLENKPAPAPWDPAQLSLGKRILEMVEHLKIHKAQLFYYLKLQGKPVNTGDLWG